MRIHRNAFGNQMCIQMACIEKHTEIKRQCIGNRFECKRNGLDIQWASKDKALDTKYKSQSHSTSNPKEIICEFNTNPKDLRWQSKQWKQMGGRKGGGPARVTHHQEIGVEFQRVEAIASTNDANLKESICKHKHDHICIKAMLLESKVDQMEMHWKSLVD